MPYCFCSGCKCGVRSKMVTTIEDEKAHQFLMGLNDEPYSHRSQILVLEPLPSIDRMFNMVSQEENHRKVM